MPYKVLISKSKSLHFKKWIKAGIIYVKDLVVEESFINEENIIGKLENKRNWIMEYSQIKKYVCKNLNLENLNNYQYVNVKK